MPVVNSADTEVWEALIELPPGGVGSNLPRRIKRAEPQQASGEEINEDEVVASMVQ